MKCYIQLLLLFSLAVDVSGECTFYYIQGETTLQFGYYPTDPGTSLGELNVFQVIGSGECSFTPTTDATWIHLPSAPITVVGDYLPKVVAVISFGLDADLSRTSRTGHIFVGNLQVAVTQMEPPCSLDLLNHNSATFYGGGTYNNGGNNIKGNVTGYVSGTYCVVAPTSTVPWIQIDSPPVIGTLSRSLHSLSVAFTVQPNPLGSTRNGSIVVLDQTFQIIELSGRPQITTTSLPTAVAGQFYRAQLSAIGGSSQYIWSATGLPPEFRINGTSLEVYSNYLTTRTDIITLTATDFLTALSDSKSLTLNSIGPNVQITTTSLPTAIRASRLQHPCLLCQVPASILGQQQVCRQGSL